MLLNPRFLAAPLLVFSLASGAAQAQMAADQTLIAESPAALAAVPAAELDAELFYEIFLGELTLRSGDPGAGYSLMLEAARQSNDEKIYQRAVEIALQSRSGEAALAAARAWETALPDAHQAQRYVLQILLALNRIGDSSTALKRFLETAPSSARKNLILSLPLLYRRASDKSSALTVVSGAVENYKNNPALAPSALLTVGRMQLLAGKPEAALASARQAQILDPASDDVTLMTLDLLQAKVPGAEAFAQSSFEGDQSPLLRMGYARILLEIQQVPQAKAQLKIVTDKHPDFPQAWLALAALQLQDGEVEASEQSLARFEVAAEGQTGNAEQRSAAAQIYMLRSEIAEKRGNFDEAETWLGRIDNADNQGNVQARRALLLARQGKLTHARALLQSLPNATVEEKSRKSAIEVQMFREAGDFKQAYAAQGQLVQQNPNDADLRYDQAILAEKAGDRAGMERILRALILSKPDYFHAYNALGYSFAERGVKLTEARKLVEKALELAPGDPFITDSLGWVEYRDGNLARAVELLAEAYGKRKDVDIAAHYGEVLWVSGDQARAKSIWEQAHRSDVSNATLRETLKRLGVTL